MINERTEEVRPQAPRTSFHGRLEVSPQREPLALALLSSDRSVSRLGVGRCSGPPKRPATLRSASSGVPAASGAGRAPATEGSRTTCGAVAERLRPVSCHYAHRSPPTEPLTGTSAALTEESENGE